MFTTASQLAPTDAPAGDAIAERERLRALVTEHLQFVWRSLRRLGVTEADADDLTQNVFLIASQRIATIAPSSERSFLFGTVLRVTAEWRRSRYARVQPDEKRVAEEADDSPGADEVIERQRLRVLLDGVLDQLPEDARAVFMLFELEGMTMAEIAELLAIPAGTVASRLRRGRADFQERVHRLRLAGMI